MSPYPSIPILSAEDVAELIPKLDVMTALRSAFCGLASGSSVQPAQTLIPLDGGGDAIIYSAAVQTLGVIAVKASPYLPSRTPPVAAYTVLVSTDTGEPVLLCDSAELTNERTAATTALAVDLLVPADAEVLAVIGAGPIAAAHLRHITPIRHFTDIRVFSPRLAGGDEAATRRMSATAMDLKFAATGREAVRDADVVLLCTSSGTPVISADDTAAEALITSISTNKPRAHEISPDALATLAVYCDYRATAPLSAGEMVIAVERGSWSSDQIVADLPELSSRSAPPRPAGRAFFRSIGLGIEDAAAANALLTAYNS